MKKKMKMNDFFTICSRRNRCDLCEKPIFNGNRMICKHKTAWRGGCDFRLCIQCIKDLSLELTEEELDKIRNQRVVNTLQNGDDEKGELTSKRERIFQELKEITDEIERRKY